MKKTELKGKVTSIDGTRTISHEEFDRLADSGSDEIDAFLDWSKARRGGSRTGAGRKRKHTVRLEVMIRPDLREKLRTQAKKRGKTQVELIESALEKL